MVLFADVAAAVDIDGGERLGVVEKDIAAALEPDLAREAAGDLGLDAVFVKDGHAPGVEFGALDQGFGHIVQVLDDLLVHLFIVDGQQRDIVGEEIADDAGEDIHILVDQSGRWRLLHLADQGLPGPDQVIEVGAEHGLIPALGDGADDQTESLRLDGAAELFEAGALAAVGDLARDPDHIVIGDQDQKTPRQGDLGGHPRPLAGNRLLGHLHQDRLAGAQLRLAVIAAVMVLTLVIIVVAASAPARSVDGVSGEDLVEGGEILADIGKMEKGVLVEADVDKGGLHALDHLGDLAVIDVADHAFIFGFFEIELSQPPVFKDCDARFADGDVDDNFFFHGTSFLTL